MHDKILQEVVKAFSNYGTASDRYFLAGIEPDEISTIGKIANSYHELMKQEEAKAEQKQHLVELTRLGNEPEVKNNCFTGNDIAGYLLSWFDKGGVMSEAKPFLDYLNDKANQYAEDRIRKSLEKAAENAKLKGFTGQAYIEVETNNGCIPVEIDKDSITSKDNYQ